MVVHHDVLQPLEPRAPWRRRGVGAVVGPRQRQRRVREREELEVVVAVDVPVESIEHVVERQRPVDGVEAEGRHAAQGDRRDDPERAKRHARGAQLVAAVDGQLRAVGEHELHRLDAGGEVAELRARPVRAGDQRARERLRVDVAEVRQREAVGVQLAHEPVQADAGLGAHEAARAVDVEYAVEPLEREQRPVGRDAAGERVPGARHAHRAPAGDGLAQLGPARRSHVLGGRARLPARPVRPHPCEATAA